MSELITPEQRRQLRKNGVPEKHRQDHIPVAKLYIPVYSCVFLLSELDPKRSLRGYGLMDAGTGYPRLEYMNIRAIQEHAETLMWPLTPDTGFVAQYPISVYAQAARKKGRYTEDETLLQDAQAELRALAQRKDSTHSVNDLIIDDRDQQIVVPSRGSSPFP